VAGRHLRIIKTKKGTTMKTKQTTSLRAKTVLLLLTLAALTLWNCTFHPEDSTPNPNPGDTSLSSAPIEQAFPGEQGDLLTGYALLDG